MVRKASAKKQQEIPGAERKTDPELDELVRAADQDTAAEGRARKKAWESRQRLRDALAAKKLKKYVYHDGEAQVTASVKTGEPKVSLKRQGPPRDADDVVDVDDPDNDEE